MDHGSSSGHTHVPRPARRSRRRARAVAMLAVLALLISGCADQISGRGTLAQVKQGGSDDFEIIGAVGSDYDTLAAKSMVDIMEFWDEEYPQISGGDAMTPLEGGVWSVDGSNPSAESRKEACLAQAPRAVEDNLMHCRLDDSVAYDRTSDFFKELSDKTGEFTIAAIFAHEMGHAVQYRLRSEPNASVLVETQADCFAGAWIGWALDGNASNFRITEDELDTTMVGYINLRDPDDSDPNSDNAHGNGFDRIAAVADGVRGGAQACMTATWRDRQITERPYTNQDDYNQGGDLPFDGVADGDVVDLGPQDLEDFWTQAFADSGRTWKPVEAKDVSSLSCSGTKISGQIGYCPKDNTVQYEDGLLRDAYEYGDFAPMTLLGLGWGMSVVNQLGRGTTDGAALLAASCYQGAYAASRNSDEPAGEYVLTLSPADMDEASIALLLLAGQKDAFGARGTSGFDRIHAFITGYFGGLPSC